MFSRRNLNKTKTYGQKTLKKLQISIEEPVVCVVVFSYYVHTIVCRTIKNCQYTNSVHKRLLLLYLQKSDLKLKLWNFCGFFFSDRKFHWSFGEPRLGPRETNIFYFIKEIFLFYLKRNWRLPYVSIIKLFSV